MTYWLERVTGINAAAHKSKSFTCKRCGKPTWTLVNAEPHCDVCDAADETSLQRLADYALIDVENALKKLPGCTGTEWNNLNDTDCVRCAMDALERAKGRWSK